MGCPKGSSVITISLCWSYSFCCLWTSTGSQVFGWWSSKCFQEEIWILCTCFPSHSTKSYIQSCDQCQLQMRNEQALTTEKVIHQSSKLKSNKIKLNAEERVGKENEGKKKTNMCTDMNWYFHYLPYLECIFEGMATHNMQSLLEWAWDYSHQTEATAMPESWTDFLNSLRIKSWGKDTFRPIFDNYLKPR